MNKYSEKLEQELSAVKQDRARLLQILSELYTAADLRKEELGEMVERAKDGDSLPSDFQLGLPRQE